MPILSRTLLAIVAFLGAALPAAAQTTSMDQGPSLLWVWGWILIVGVIVFIVGTSLGVRGNR